ncbi:DUF5389 family protein [Haemophilus influenzae]|uniref:DUF5389 family protein n=1 Tax=Haemophilus influenzae TaxID=727 RepID=UPI000DD3FB6C|nr:DUF5389 family protein [Haemophilus influenzae]MCK8936389.1 DUF5389 family protein [Haemophilus influenzae]MCK8939859.1 DUF5389 family protein [Haemophilus influenzae]MCK9062485.1 DUF5389 family protein [Haemophilus influenzae]MCK9071403.1 DUF5389 family protein [Haemophilus influenzae]MCK9080129.1 DUF5389 family protein [Haemophilus influenzae]
MKKQSLPTKFSPFAWGLAAFCSPILLCPMALLISTAFSKNPYLSSWQINLFSTLFWVYPFILAVTARMLYRLHQHKPKLANKLLILSAVIFYMILITICKIGL